MRHKPASSSGIEQTYKKAMELGIDIDVRSDENLIRVYASDLRKLESGGKGKWASSSVKHRLRKMGVLTPRSLTLTESGLKLLDELEA